MIMILEYLRNQNVLHRDIKPENLIFDEIGYVYLTDFGIGKICKNDNSGDYSGTPGYLSPEVLNGKHHSFQSDYFSLGIIAYELMFGKRPYHSTNKKQYKEEVLAYKIILTQTNNKYNWSLDGLDFINGLLTRNQDKRLGASDIEELKTHKWFQKYDFASLFRKEIESPLLKFIDLEDYFNEKYCNQTEIIDQETKQRYSSYITQDKFISLFMGFTYMNPLLDENHQNNNTSINNGRNTKFNEKGLSKIKDYKAKLSLSSIKTIKRTNSNFMVKQEYKKILPQPQKHQFFLKSNRSVHCLHKQTSTINSSISNSNLNNSIDKETFKIGTTGINTNKTYRKFSPPITGKQLLNPNDEKVKKRLSEFYSQRKKLKENNNEDNFPTIKNYSSQKHFIFNKYQIKHRVNSSSSDCKFNYKDCDVYKENINFPKIKKKMKH